MTEAPTQAEIEQAVRVLKAAACYVVEMSAEDWRNERPLPASVVREPHVVVVMVPISGADRICRPAQRGGA